MRLKSLALALGRAELLWIGGAIALVWSAEAFNTALELLADVLHPARHAGIGRAKDVAAAVLIAALGAAPSVLCSCRISPPWFADAVPELAERCACSRR